MSSRLMLWVSAVFLWMSPCSSIALAQMDASGHWEGSVKLPNMELRIMIDLFRGTDKSWSGAIDIPPQGLKGFPLAHLVVQNDLVSFDMQGIPGMPAFKGKLTESGRILSGDFSQNGMTFPFKLERKGDARPSDKGQKAAAALPAKGLPGAGLDGIWQGALSVGPMELRLVLKVAKAADGSFSGKMDSLDQGASDLPVPSIILTGDDVQFEMKSIQGSYTGKLNQNKSEINGQWTQGGMTRPLTFKRTDTDKVARLNRPQEPKKPYPYDEEEVTYENRKAGVRLGGTLTLPRTTGPFPAVLLITGSGAQDRNETVMGHRPFLVLADYLTRRGIAVLRMDDRGVGSSTGSVEKSTSADFAEDALAGVVFLKSRKEIHPGRIGLVGHSEGGIVAPMAAVRSKDVAFIVLLAGSGLTGEEILYRQARLIARASGAGDQAIAKNQELQERTFQILKEEKDDATAEKRIREEYLKAMAGMSDEEKKTIGASLQASMNGQIKMVTSPWFRYFLTYDPKPALEKVTCPVLAINGEKDLQVPAKEDLAAIGKALAVGGNKDYQTIEMPGLNHLFQTCVTGALSEYSKIEETMSPALLDTVAAWILRRTK